MNEENTIKYMADDDLFISLPAENAKEYDLTEKNFDINVVTYDGFTRVPKKKLIKQRTGKYAQVCLIFPLQESNIVSTHIITLEDLRTEYEQSN